MAWMLVDLRELGARCETLALAERLLVAAYDGIYRPAFPTPEEQESLEQYRSRLFDTLEPAPQPVMHMIVAHEQGSEDVQGFIIGELYRDSSCGLITFLAISEAHRTGALAADLLAAAKRALRAEAEGRGRPLRALFGEMHHPGLVAEGADVVSPNARARLIRWAGGRWVPVAYVQPPLQEGAGRARNLVLMAFDPDGPGAPRGLTRSAVADFLHEFYRALGVADPDSDDDFRTAVAGLEAATLPTTAPPHSLAAQLDPHAHASTERLSRAPRSGNSPAR